MCIQCSFDWGRKPARGGRRISSCVHACVYHQVIVLYPGWLYCYSLRAFLRHWSIVFIAILWDWWARVSISIPVYWIYLHENAACWRKVLDEILQRWSWSSHNSKLVMSFISISRIRGPLQKQYMLLPRDLIFVALHVTWGGLQLMYWNVLSIYLAKKK